MDHDTPRPATQLRWRLLYMALLFGPPALFFYQQEFILAVAWVLVGLTALCGYCFGAAHLLGSFAGLAAAIVLAPSIGKAQAFRLQQWLGTSGLTNRFLCIVIVGILVSLVVTLVFSLVARHLARQHPHLDLLNRRSGFLLGALQGVVAIAILLGGVLTLEPIEKERAERRSEDDARGQLVSRLVLRSAELTRASKLGPVIETYNPFERIPELNKIQEVQRTAEVLSDPEKIDQLLHHPSIRALQQDEGVKQAVERLTSDPKVREILDSGEPMNRTAAWTLLSHPALMNLVDQPGFLEQATQAILDTGVISHLPQ